MEEEIAVCAGDYHHYLGPCVDRNLFIYLFFYAIRALFSDAFLWASFIQIYCRLG